MRDGQKHDDDGAWRNQIPWDHLMAWTPLQETLKDSGWEGETIQPHGKRGARSTETGGEKKPGLKLSELFECDVTWWLRFYVFCGVLAFSEGFWHCPTSVWYLMQLSKVVQ
jgi:hypothetical protein